MKYTIYIYNIQHVMFLISRCICLSIFPAYTTFTTRSCTGLMLKTQRLLNNEPSPLGSVFYSLSGCIVVLLYCSITFCSKQNKHNLSQSIQQQDQPTKSFSNYHEWKFCIVRLSYPKFWNFCSRCRNFFTGHLASPVR